MLSAARRGQFNGAQLKSRFGQAGDISAMTARCQIKPAIMLVETSKETSIVVAEPQFKLYFNKQKTLLLMQEQTCSDK